MKIKISMLGLSLLFLEASLLRVTLRPTEKTRQ